MMMMGLPVFGVIALVFSTALLVWVSGKDGNPAQGFGKAVAWISVLLSVLFLAGQLYVCSKMCMSGHCKRMMGGMHMMDRMDKMGVPEGSGK